MLQAGNNVHAGGLSGFYDVDRADDPHSLIKHLDRMNANERVQITKLELIRTLHPQNGKRILDVACGVGHDAQLIARFVGRTGCVLGIDKSRTMITEAKRRAATLRLPLEFHVANAENLGFEDATIDGCLVVSALIHMENPQKALEEICRVLKPKGRCAVLEPDWDTFVLAIEDTTAAQSVVDIIKNSFCHSGIAHKLPVLLRQLGLQTLGVKAGTLLLSDYAAANDAWRIEEHVELARKAGFLSLGHARKLVRQLQSASETGLFFGMSTGLAVVGQKL
jgi:ubiquinone/menaquinone biosynthesis C-methylase UbiE